MSRHKHTEHVKVKSLKPIRKAFIQNATLPAVNTAWLSSNIRPKHAPCAIRVSVAVDTAGTFSAMMIHHGNTQVLNLNQGSPLVVDSLYIFEVMAHRGDRVNFQYDSTGGIIKILRVEEIDDSVGVGRVSYQ